MAEGRQGRGAAAKRDYAQQDRLLALAEPSDAAAAAAAWLRTDTALDRGAVEAHCATELLKQCLAMPDSSASFSVLFTSDQAIQGLSELTPTTALGLPDGAALKNREYSGDSDVAVHERTEVARFPVAKFDVQLHAQGAAVSARMRVVAAQFQRYQKHACHVAVKGIEDARGDGGGDDALVRVLLDTATGGAPTISGTRRPLVFSNLELVLDGGGGGSGSSRQRSGGAGDVGGASRVKPVGKKKSDSIQPTPRGAHEGVTAVVPKFEDVAVDFGATQARLAGSDAALVEYTDLCLQPYLWHFEARQGLRRPNGQPLSSAEVQALRSTFGGLAGVAPPDPAALAGAAAAAAVPADAAALAQQLPPQHVVPPLELQVAWLTQELGQLSVQVHEHSWALEGHDKAFERLEERHRRPLLEPEPLPQDPLGDPRTHQELMEEEGEMEAAPAAAASQPAAPSVPPVPPHDEARLAALARQALLQHGLSAEWRDMRAVAAGMREALPDHVPTVARCIRLAGGLLYGLLGERLVEAQPPLPSPLDHSARWRRAVAV